MLANEDICRDIVYHHLNNPAMWSVFLIQDLLAMDKNLRHENPSDERVNDPSDPDHYWNYRMKATVDELLSSKSFNHSLKEMIRSSGR